LVTGVVEHEPQDQLDYGAAPGDVALQVSVDLLVLKVQFRRERHHQALEAGSR
jgi:hypothetical protein